MPTPQELFMMLTGPTAWDQARGVPAGWTQGDPVTWDMARPGMPADWFSPQAPGADAARLAGQAQLYGAGYTPPSANAPWGQYSAADQAAQAQQPPDWTQNPMWQYRQGGQGPLAGVPYEEWGYAMEQLNAALPWAQMQQYAANDAAARDQWLMNYQAGRQDRGFDQWLAAQQLAQQGGQLGADNAWRQRQLDLQAQMQAHQLGPQWQAQQAQQGWQNQFQDRDWQAAQAQQAWANQFNQQQLGEDTRRWGMGFDEGRRQFDVGQGNWQQQFQAGRDDALWSRGFSERQFGEDTRRWDTDFARQQALDQWNQAFATGQFDWQKARAVEQDALQREGMAMGAFGRRFGPAVGSM